jgi:hypothetical protein
VYDFGRCAGAGCVLVDEHHVSFMQSNLRNAWITSLDPTLFGRLGDANVSVSASCSPQPVQTFTRQVMFPACPL